MVFLFVLIIVILLTVLLIFSKINIQVINLEFMSRTKKHLNDNYAIILKLYILSKIPIMKIQLTKEKLEKLKVKEKVKTLDLSILEDKNTFDKNLFEAIKKIKMQIRKINLNIELGTENACLTSVLVPAISTAIAIYLRKKIDNYENQIFIIQPIFTNQNLINIYFSGIFEIKMIHIINMIHVLKKKGEVKKYERTSNRRSYDYSYE